MNWTVILVLALLVGYIVSETVGSTLKEGFATPLRTDVSEEVGGYRRDERYTASFVDIQGIGVATDFCRAVYRATDPDSLRISCALGQREGMNTMEYNSLTKREGFRFSRDDYWTQRKGHNRMDYCRILKDADTGEWYSSCAVTSHDGFKKKEERDANPPLAIQGLLEAYEGIMTWFRWQDDRDDYAQTAAFSVHGSPVWPTLLKPEVTRGLQLNRWPAASQEAGEPAPPIRDFLRWGEAGTFELNQAIQPRQIRAIAFWVWWDAFEKGALIMECKNPSRSTSKMDRIALGVEGGGPDLPGIHEAKPAQELRPDVVQAIGQMTEPSSPSELRPATPSKAATYFFEIWDQEQRIMRLNGPMGSAKTGAWQHVAVTTTDATAWWPTWQMWIDGVMVSEKTDGRLSPAMELKENYIGTSVRGCIQDFRMYSTPMIPGKINAAISWGKPKLHPMP